MHLENVEKFCYLGDAYVEWGLMRKKVALKLKCKVYMTCVRSAMVYGSET